MTRFHPLPASSALRATLMTVPLLALAACAGSRAAEPATSATAAPSDVGLVVDGGSGSTAAAALNGAQALTADESRVEKMLVGRFPGVDVAAQPRGGYSIRIRGTRSLMGSNEPLIVVDGIPMSDGSILRDLTPNQIRRVEMLKDAGSTAAYGSRGANGVILITTKGNY